MEQAIAVLIVATLTVVTNAQPQVLCTREGPICTDCNTLGYCNKNGTNYELDSTLEEKCMVDFVCDEWSLRCEREGTCRYKQFSCPTTEIRLVPDPYSCRGYYSCVDAFMYACDPGMLYDVNVKDCTTNSDNPLCYDYPVLCEKVGQKTEIGQFKFECVEEVGPPHIIYPKLVA